MDVKVRFNNSITDTTVIADTLLLSVPGAASGTLLYEFQISSLRALAPADATGINEIFLSKNVAQTTITSGGPGAGRGIAFVPLDLP